jgi:membrane fusion protein
MRQMTQPGSTEPASEEVAGVGGGFAETDAAHPVPLFRPEAVAAALNAGEGRPVALLPISWTVLTLVLMLMAGVVAACMTLGTYARSESAVGIVNSTGTSARIGAPVAGILTRLYVREGQQVRAGEPLGIVSTERIGVDGTSIDDGTVNSLNRELTSLEERLAVLAPTAALQRQGASARLAALGGSKSAEHAAEIAATQRLRLAEDAMHKMAPVAQKGFISGEAMRRRQEEIITLREARSEARSRQSSLDAQMDELRTELQALPYALVQQRGELLSQIARARREKDMANGQRGYLIRAPVAGTVTALQARQGQGVDQRGALLTVASSNGSMGAELYVPSRAIGFIEPGQRVRIRYDAFPYQRFGAGGGSIRHVSRAVLRPEDIQAAVDVKEPMYRVTVELDHPWLAAYGRRHPLQTGMAVSADIVLEERSFGAWLLEPILALRGRL